MRERIQQHSDLLLLLWLLLSIVAYPLLDQSTGLRLIRGVMMFVLLIIAIVTVSEKKGWLWQLLFLFFAAVVFAIAGHLSLKPAFVTAFVTMQWVMLTACFAVIVSVLFSYLRQARTIADAHLFTAASIYLLLGLVWFSLYNAIEVMYPGSFLQGSTPLTERRNELLYFSLATLTTVGYGDIVPVGSLARMLAALEAAAGVLYVAITVALLVSAHKGRHE